MSLTRDSIQGFIDGYLKAGGNATNIETDIVDWMDKHPVYPQSKQVQDVIKNDLASYRGTIKVVPPETVPMPSEETIP